MAPTKTNKPPVPERKGKLARTMKQPFSVARRAWKDYKVGRTIRKSKKEPEQAECKRNEEKAIEPREVQEYSVCSLPTLSIIASPMTEVPNPCRKSTKGPLRLPPARPRESSPRRGWQFNRADEFPWRYRQIVYEESDWRGTWTLEVKDMQGMDWGTPVRAPNENGCGGKYQHKPTKHLPFPPNTRQQRGDSVVLSDGGQDDLLCWLGKPVTYYQDGTQ